MNPTRKPYEITGFGAMDVTKPYEFIGFGAMDVTKPCEWIGFVFGGGDCSPGGVPPPDLPFFMKVLIRF